MNKLHYFQGEKKKCLVTSGRECLGTSCFLLSKDKDVPMADHKGIYNLNRN